MYIQIRKNPEKINQYKNLIFVFESKPKDLEFSNPKLSFYADKISISYDFVNTDKIGTIHLSNNDYVFVGSVKFNRNDIIEYI
jgi:hypothetical protein